MYVFHYAGFLGDSWIIGGDLKQCRGYWGCYSIASCHLYLSSGAGCLGSIFICGWLLWCLAWVVLLLLTGFSWFFMGLLTPPGGFLLERLDIFYVDNWAATCGGMISIVPGTVLSDRAPLSCIFSLLCLRLLGEGAESQIVSGWFTCLGSLVHIDSLVQRQD